MSDIKKTGALPDELTVTASGGSGLTMDEHFYHTVCGTELAQHQITGEMHCPHCKKAVPFNEIIKSTAPPAPLE